MSAAETIGTLLEEATRNLAAVSRSPRLDAELLLARAIDMPRSYLYAHPEDEPDADAISRFRAAIERRLAGEPMAYISGSREFWSLELAVSPATLVPRPETEILVELALRELPRDAAAAILDLGTGSGAIALALAKERPGCRITATDISPDALDVARLNAREHGLANIDFRCGSWLEPVRGQRFDLVVSNPPYIAEGDGALAGLAFEPRGALVAGPDGLAAIRELAHASAAVIRPGGVLLIEHGATQQEAVAALLESAGWTGIECAKDHAGLPRVTRAVCSQRRSVVDTGTSRNDGRTP